MGSTVEVDRQFLRLLSVVDSVYRSWQMNIKVVSNVMIQTFSVINLTIKVELLNLIFLINPKYLLISYKPHISQKKKSCANMYI